MAEFVPSAERVRSCASDTEATMYADRLARAYTGRDRILKVADSTKQVHHPVVSRT